MENFGYRPHYLRRRNLKILLSIYAYKPTVLDCERSLFCSKIRSKKNAKQVSVPSIASVTASLTCERQAASIAGVPIPPPALFWKVYTDDAG